MQRTRNFRERRSLLVLVINLSLIGRLWVYIKAINRSSFSIAPSREVPGSMIYAHARKSKPCPRLCECRPTSYANSSKGFMLPGNALWKGESRWPRVWRVGANILLHFKNWRAVRGVTVGMKGLCSRHTSR